MGVKITDLTAITSINNDVLFELANDPSGTPESRSITWGDMKDEVGTYQSVDQTLTGNRNIFQGANDLIHEGSAGAYWQVDGVNEGLYYDYGLERGAIGTEFPDAKFHVKGSSLDDLFLVEDFLGSNRFVVEDDGKLLTGSGIGAVDFGFGQTHRVGSFNTGFAYYSEAGVVTNTSIQHRGSTVNPIGLNVSFQNNPTGLVKAIIGNVPGGGGTEHTGVKGQSKDGSQYSIGVDGLIVGGGGTTPSIYSSATRGLNQSGVDSLSFGGRYISQYNNAGLVYSKDMVGVHGEGVGVIGDALSTGKIVGGRFLTTGTTGTGDRIAIHVPETDNNGSVLIGGDSKTSQEALVEFASTTEAFLIMRMTGLEALAITPVDGMMLYATATSGAITSVGFWGYESGAWVKL